MPPDNKSMRKEVLAMTGRTGIRVREIHRRTQLYRRWHEYRVFSHLMALSLFLLAGVGFLWGNVQSRGISTVLGSYGSVLLRNGTNTYVIVGIAAFIMGVTLTVFCTRCRKKLLIRTKYTEESEE